MTLGTSNPSAELPAGSSGTRSTILLVEDDPMVTEIVSELIASLGYEVLSVARPADAVAEFEKHQECIAIMLTDWLMPGMNGQELAEMVYQIDPALKVIFMSGRPPDKVPAGRIMNFLQKPFGREDLARKLTEVMQQPPSPAS